MGRRVRSSAGAGGRGAGERWRSRVGGKDDFEADRVSAETVASAFPTIRLAARENRKLLRRAVTYLAAEQGITQFLDIGTDLPSAGNVHEVAQAIDPRSRIVYVDNDPIVLVHARALLTSAPEGATAYIEADLCDRRRSSAIRSCPACWTCRGRWR